MSDLDISKQRGSRKRRCLQDQRFESDSAHCSVTRSSTGSGMSSLEKDEIYVARALTTSPELGHSRAGTQAPCSRLPSDGANGMPSIPDSSVLSLAVDAISPGGQTTGRADVSPVSLAAPSGNVDLYGGQISPDEITVPAAASFFRTYFSVIHPQYPFLDVKLCSEYYQAWKNSRSTGGRLLGWPLFFVRMIFALGSLIESRPDNSPLFKPQNLKSTAQAEQSIMADSTSTPLIRLQAMLMSAMFALHAENTWRIAHISGAIMKFATLHRFHRLHADSDGLSSSLETRVWSCAYVLDRAVSSALGIPVSLPDMYITSPLFEAVAHGESPAPWLRDCNITQKETVDRDLCTFSHICKARSIQSFFQHMVEKEDLGDNLPLELEMRMMELIKEWEDPRVIATHSDGYESPMWLQHIGHLTRLSVCHVCKSNIFSPTADTALRAGCDVCVSFRSLQKRKRIAQPWLVVISQFRAAVTLWYIVWAREIPVPREVNDALRDCSAVLAIFAEKWPKAEQYRDCFEYLATAIPRCTPPGNVPPNAKFDLMDLVRKVEETGIHRTTSRMLREICAEDATL